MFTYKLAVPVFFSVVWLIPLTVCDKCPNVPISECCRQAWTKDCPQPQCYADILQKCREKGNLTLSPGTASKDLRRSPQKTEEPKCGTAEMNYHPCTSKSVANKLFTSCCELYVPKECQFMCTYETDQIKAKALVSFFLKDNLILRDNRQCCQDLDLNANQLMVGSRCLRMCDPSGTLLGKITKEDVTCLFNWNVIMYCHHSGIREM